MIVIDASVVIAAWSDPGSKGDWAAPLVRAGGLAPHVLPAEVVSGLRRKGWQQTEPLGDELLALSLLYEPFGPYADRVWELRDNVTPYDAWYVAIAETHEVPMATTDRRLARAPGLRCDFRLPPE